MKPISELLQQMDQLDANVPEYEAPLSFVGTTEAISEEPEAEPMEADVDELPSEPVEVDEPRDIDDPTQPSVTVQELPEGQEPSVAVDVEPDPVVQEMDVPEEQPPEVPEPSVESISDPSIDEAAVAEVGEPDTAQPFVEPIDDPGMDAPSTEDVSEPSVPESDVGDMPAMPDTATPVGYQGTFEESPITSSEYESRAEYDDAPTWQEVDRQVSTQVASEQARGDDLASRIASEMREMVLDAMHAREQTVREVADQELSVLTLMEED